LFDIRLGKRLGLIAQVLLHLQRGKELWVVILRITLLLAGQQYTPVQIIKSSDF
jgi:plasmid maintenance system antidote protein VapI